LPREPFLPMLRELARCYQAFEAYSGAHVRGLGLTPAQFDIVATLGNTPGMSFKELGEKTLITKGTLTGVVDRLEAQRLVRRSASAEDGRSMIVSLTPAGARLFDKRLRRPPRPPAPGAGRPRRRRSCSASKPPARPARNLRIGAGHGTFPAAAGRSKARRKENMNDPADPSATPAPPSACTG
jgi:MarR family 2-MHQ and catechol resistance regulon transcriptional repressor